jgi:bacterioferritin-associated ferredoxin
MIICHCRQVTDRAIRACVRDGAVHEGQIAAMCGAGSLCGGCRSAVSEILDAELRVRGVRRLPVVTFLGDHAPLEADAAE